MECSTFVFGHIDLGPSNIMVGPDLSIGIIDREMAGIFPASGLEPSSMCRAGWTLVGVMYIATIHR